MSEPLVYYVNDRSPSFEYPITVDGSPYNLSGKTLTFKMRLVGSSTTKVSAAAAAKTPPGTDGIVTYAWAAGDLDTEGLYLAWVEVAAAGVTQTILETLVEVRSHARKTTGIVELEEVRLAMELDVSDRSVDTRILELIPVATRLIAEETKRELLPTASATRRRSTRSGVIDLSPWELRTASAVVLDPDGAAKTLTAGSDYLLTPVGGAEIGGTYTELVLSTSIQLGGYSSFSRFGVLPISITGDWGMSSVPAIAKEAAIDCVRSWLRKSTPTYAGYGGGEERGPAPPAEGTYALPLSAKTKLRALRRDVLGVGIG